MRFRKGNIPWNKGLTKETDERIKTKDHHGKNNPRWKGGVTFKQGYDTRQKRQWRINNPGYEKKYYLDNLEKIKEYTNQWRKEKHDWIDNYKLLKGCAICGYKKCVSALEFHHEGDKEFCIGCGEYGFKKLKEEIEKCEVLCANCHRELHNKGKING